MKSIHIRDAWKYKKELTHITKSDGIRSRSRHSLQSQHFASRHLNQIKFIRVFHFYQKPLWNHLRFYNETNIRSIKYFISFYDIVNARIFCFQQKTQIYVFLFFFFIFLSDIIVSVFGILSSFGHNYNKQSALRGNKSEI